MSKPANNQDDLQFAMRGFEQLQGAATLFRHRKLTSDFTSTILLLIGFGLEISLKGQLLYGRVNKKEIRKFGHDLVKLWHCPIAEPFRMKSIAAISRLPSGDECYVETLDSHIVRLDELHGNKTDFSLRYFTDADATAPSPVLMLTAFRSAAQNLIFQCIERWEAEQPDDDAIETFKSKLAESHYFSSPLDLLGDFHNGNQKDQRKG